MLSGMTRVQVQIECAKKWRIDRRTARTYMAMIEEQWRAGEKEIDPVMERQRLRERFELVLRGIVADRDWGPAVALLKQMARMVPGMELPMQVEHSGPGGGPVRFDLTRLDLATLTDEQLRALELLGPALPQLFLPSTTAEPDGEGGKGNG